MDGLSLKFSSATKKGGGKTREERKEQTEWMGSEKHSHTVDIWSVPALSFNISAL